MGQQEILDLLKKYKIKVFTAKEISEYLNTGIGSVHRCLRKLREQSLINYEYCGNNKVVYWYKKEGNSFA